MEDRRIEEKDRGSKDRGSKDRGRDPSLPSRPEEGPLKKSTGVLLPPGALPVLENPQHFFEDFDEGLVPSCRISGGVGCHHPLLEVAGSNVFSPRDGLPEVIEDIWEDHYPRIPDPPRGSPDLG